MTGAGIGSLRRRLSASGIARRVRGEQRVVDRVSDRLRPGGDVKLRAVLKLHVEREGLPAGPAGTRREQRLEVVVYVSSHLLPPPAVNLRPLLLARDDLAAVVR